MSDPQSSKASEGTENKVKKPKGSILKKIALAMAVSSAAAAAGFSWYLFKELEGINTYIVPQRLEPYELKAGMSARDVIFDLTRGVYHKYLIELYLKLNSGRFDTVLRGSYLIDGSKTLTEILEDMKAGAVIEISPERALIIEGLSYPLMLENLIRTTNLKDDLEECLKDPEAFIKNGLDMAFSVTSIEGVVEVGGDEAADFYPKDLDNLEGLFMPAAYPYFEDGTACDILKASFVNMARTLKKLWAQKDEDLPLKNPYEALILASIVERETGLAEERGVIAGVFYNRLKLPMRLQTDPTVMYGISPSFRGALNSAQLKEDTPYNTYTRDGLPPTPIAMPSQAAIEAVLHPDDTNALFFVAKSHDPRDGHVFSATLKEHQQAVKEYRRRVREYRRSKAR